MHLIDVFVKKIKGSQILSFIFLFLLLLSIYISMLFCKSYTQFREERERGREKEFSIVVYE
jgi:hypothetical protein